MSKIVITIDTEEKSISAKIDDTTYDDVEGLSIYKYIPYNEDEVGLEFSMSLNDVKYGDITKRTVICLSKSTAGQKILAENQSSIITNKDGIIVAKMPKSLGELVGNILKNKKSK